MLWSSAYIAIRASLPGVSPLFFLTIRFALATVLLLLVIATIRRTWSSLGRVWHHLAIAGILINGLYLSAGYLALQHINAATMALIMALHPMVTGLLAHPLLNETMRPLQWPGLALGLAGVIQVVGEDAARIESLIGASIDFAGVVCLALGTIHYRKHCRDVNLEIANAIQISSAGQFMVPAAEEGSAFLAYVGHAIDDGLWLHNDQHLAPIRQDPGKDHPQQLIRRSHQWPG